MSNHDPSLNPSRLGGRLVRPRLRLGPLRRRGRGLLFAGVLLVVSTAAAAAGGGGEQDAPAAFRAAAERVMPSVVTIETYGGSGVPARSRGGRIAGFSRPGEGPTTGLVVSPDGYILTSTYNFIRRPNIITVVLDDGSRHVAKLRGRDQTRKLCVLKIDTDAPLAAAAIAPVDALRVGQWAVSVGVGYGGQEAAMSAGILSALGRVSGRAVQTDANISPANYGGPLVDVTGRVIGVCVPLSPGGDHAMAGVQWYDSGIGFAVPLDGLDEVLDRLKKGQTIQRGRLGIIARPVSTGQGVRIVRIAPHSPATAAGLHEGDVITAVDGEKVLDLFALRAAIGRYVAGDTIKIDITGEDQRRSVEVTLEPGPFKFPKPRADENGDGDEDSHAGEPEPPGDAENDNAPNDQADANEGD